MQLITRSMTVGTSIVLAIAVLLLKSTASQGAVEGPRLKISHSQINLGAVWAYEETTRIVNVENIGNEPLVIDRIISLCTCVTTDHSTLTIAPGDEQSFRIMLEVSNYTKPEINGDVRIYSNDPNEPEVNIAVNGTIRPEYEISASKIDFGRIEDDSPKSHRIVIDQKGKEPLRIEGVSATEGLSATFTSVPQTRGPETSAAQYFLDVTLDRMPTSGSFSGKVIVQTNIVRMPVATIRVNAYAPGLEFAVSPKMIRFDEGEVGAAIGAVSITGADLSNVSYILQDESTLSAELVNVVPHQEWRLDLQLLDASTSGKVVEKIELMIGNDDETERVNVGVLGRIK